jgi:pimeloyl-ACP methyl ester carboxylesterase
MATRIALLIVALALAGGCSTTWYERLPREADLPVHHELAQKAAALPNHRGHVTVGEVDGEPVRVAYRHTRGGRSGWLVVMLSGVLSDATALRFLAGGLGEEHDLLLVDYLGCGESDKPDPEDLPPDAYSPSSLARHVLLVIRERARDERIAVMGHSLGSLVVLRMLGDPALREEFPEEIAKIERAVLLSPIDFAIAARQEKFAQVAELTAVEVKLGYRLGILRELLSRSYFECAGDSARMPREAAESAERVLSDLPRLRTGQAMLRQAVPFRDENCLDWDRIGELVAEYRNVAVPVLLISGARDCTFPCAMGYKLRVQLPRAWLRVLRRCGHSMNLERPVETATWIDSFLEEAGEGWEPVVDGVVAAAAPAASSP